MREAAVGEWGPRLLEALIGLEDPKKPRGVRHPLPTILALAVCAITPVKPAGLRLGGAHSLYTIAQ